MIAELLQRFQQKNGGSSSSASVKRDRSGKWKDMNRTKRIKKEVGERSHEIIDLETDGKQGRKRKEIGKAGMEGGKIVIDLLDNDDGNENQDEGAVVAEGSHRGKGKECGPEEKSESIG